MAIRSEQDWISVVRCTYGAHGLWITDQTRDLRIGLHLSKLHLQQRLPDTLLEFHADEVGFDVKNFPFAAEVLPELLLRACKNRVPRALEASSTPARFGASFSQRMAVRPLSLVTSLSPLTGDGIVLNALP
jgi:hypothetical protein